MAVNAELVDSMEIEADANTNSLKRLIDSMLVICKFDLEHDFDLVSDARVLLKCHYARLADFH
jgi:hypothetical protein